MLTQLTKAEGVAHKKIIVSCMDYLFGAITKLELRKRVDDKQLLSSLLGDGYLIRNCKLYVYAKHKGLTVDPKSFGIHPKDVRLLDKIADRYDDIKGCKPIGVKTFSEFETNLTNKLKVYIGKFVSKKMTFLIKSYGLSRHDIESFLLYKGLWTLCIKYPYFDTDLHALNTVKRAIHNAGMDIITKHTRKKNQRLVKNSDGTFESVNIDCSVLVDLEAPQPYETRLKEEKDSLRSLQNCMNKKGALFITLARGDYDKDFSEYLGFDNREGAEGNYNAYLKSVQRYLGVTPEETQKWFSKIRTHII